MPKQRASRPLALLGGRPRFAEPLHVNRPTDVRREPLHRRIDELLDRHWLSDGPLVRDFEKEIARVTGTRHCVATCNGTLAIEVAVSALELTGEVIVPSFTYVATAQALRRLGIKPVYCEVDPATHCIDPGRAEKLITPRTSAIMGVHLWGNPCAIEDLEAVAERGGVRLLFDAAHALGSAYRGRPVGGFGSLETFSFHATKLVSTGEGGAITTDDDVLAERLRAARSFGFDASGRIAGNGTNAKMSELSAALGLTHIDRFEELREANRTTLEAYRAGLHDVPGIGVFETEEIGRSNAQYIVTLVDETVTGLTRDEILRSLEAENVLAKRYFHPGCHRLDPTHGSGVTLPVTDRLCQTVLVLPGGAAIEAEAIDEVCRLLSQVIDEGDRVRLALKGG